MPFPPELRDMRDSWALGINAFTVLAGIACFFPCFAVSSHRETAWSRDASTGSADAAAATAALFVAILPGLDFMTDFFNVLPLTVEEADLRRKQVMDNTPVTTLTVVEKALFIVGLLCLSVPAYPALSQTDAWTQTVLGGCFINASSVWTTGAILSFLCRRSTTFHQQMCAAVAALVVAAAVTTSAVYVAPPTLATSAVATAAGGLYDAAVAMYLLACAVAAAKAAAASAATKNIVWVNCVRALRLVTGDTVVPEDTEAERSRRFVVGTTMAATAALLVANAPAHAAWFVRPTAPTHGWGREAVNTYVSAAAAVLVFFADAFARRSDVAVSLGMLLENKKGYVRYISHEIRTPLSTTVMGLKMVLDDFKGHPPRPGSRDADRLDTLQVRSWLMHLGPYSSPA